MLFCEATFSGLREALAAYVLDALAAAAPSRVGGFILLFYNLGAGALYGVIFSTTSAFGAAALLTTFILQGNNSNVIELFYLEVSSRA